MSRRVPFQNRLISIISEKIYIEHIPLNIRNNVINQISNFDFKYMFINVPNELGPAILIKNIGSKLMGYIRHKEYSIQETFYALTYQLDKIKPHIDGHKAFDWRVLYYTLMFYFDVEIKTSPNNFTPKSFSPSIFFICKKKSEKNL